MLFWAAREGAVSAPHLLRGVMSWEEAWRGAVAYFPHYSTISCTTMFSPAEADSPGAHMFQFSAALPSDLLPNVVRE